MRESTQPKFIQEGALEQERELNPEEVRNRVEGAMAKIKEGVPEGEERIFEKGEVPFGTMYSHFADMIMASAYALKNNGYLTEEERLLLIGRENNIIYMAGFLDKQTGERLQLKAIFKNYFGEKISLVDRRKYRLAKTKLRPVE